MNLKDFTTYFESLQAELSRSREFEPGDIRIKQNIHNTDLAGIAYYITHTISENTDWLGNYLSCNVANCTEMFHSFQLDFGKLLNGTEQASPDEPFKQKGLLLGLDVFYSMLKEHFEASASALPTNDAAEASNDDKIGTNADKIVSELKQIQNKMDANAAPTAVNVDLSSLETRLDEICEAINDVTAEMPGDPDDVDLTKIETKLENIESHLSTLVSRVPEAKDAQDASEKASTPSTEVLSALPQSIADNVDAIVERTTSITDSTQHIAEVGASLYETTYNIAANLIALSTNSAVYTHTAQNIENNLSALSKSVEQIADNTLKLKESQGQDAAHTEIASNLNDLLSHTAVCTLTVQRIEKALNTANAQLADNAKKLEHLSGSNANSLNASEITPNDISDLVEAITANTEKITENTDQIAASVQKLVENNEMLNQNIGQLTQKCDRMVRVLELLVVSMNQHGHTSENSRLHNSVSELQKVN